VPFPNRDTQFQPGQSGNPSGRPRTKPITDRLREALEEIGDDGRPLAEAVMRQWLSMVADGDVSALRELLDRVEGTVVQGLKHEHDGGLTIRVEYADDVITPAASTPPGASEDPA
jgi:Family of unknown function (DUF5681)